MRLLTGINHVAIVTDDLDRFVDFYTSVFEVEVVFSETTPAFRHAILRTGNDSWLHPAEVAASEYGAALPAMFDRGHLDHCALTVATSEAFDLLRRRLVERNVSTGAVDSLGAFHSLWFRDPDGMQVEVVLIVDPDLREFHEPRPLVAAAPNRAGQSSPAP